jgi:excisionase family DNA binding protein
MKLSDLVILAEVDDEDKKHAQGNPDPENMTTLDAAEDLGVVRSRVRQLIGSGDLPAKRKPGPGRRDYSVKKKDVQQLKKKSGSHKETKEDEPESAES